MVLGMRTVLVQRGAFAVLPVVVVLGACVSVDTSSDSEEDTPRIVVTTNILGDVVRNLVGDDAEVEVVMPPNADPHDFAPSARQAQAMREADVLVINGLGFEAGLVDTIDAAEDDGVTVLTATDAVDPLPLGPDAGEEQGTPDPHVFTDPARMALVAEALTDELAAAVDGLDTAAFRNHAQAYTADLAALDAEVEQILAPVPPERRVLVTNHDVFGYFAERYGFEILGAVIPAGSTLAEPSAADLDDLATLIADSGVPAVFADTSAPSRLADALAAEGADVEVVDLYSESLGDAGSDGATYVDMVRTNAHRIADALT